MGVVWAELVTISNSRVVTSKENRCEWYRTPTLLKWPGGRTLTHSMISIQFVGGGGMKINQVVSMGGGGGLHYNNVTTSCIQ